MTKMRSMLLSGILCMVLGSAAWGADLPTKKEPVAGTLDGVIEYDPMGASYAFSVIGWSGLTAGAGDTEDARVTSAVKYRNQIGNFRIGALAQLGGYDLNNGAQEIYEGQIGGDANLGAYGKLSLDGIISFDKGAISSGISKLPNTVSATISDDSSLMILGK